MAIYHYLYDLVHLFTGEIVSFGWTPPPDDEGVNVPISIGSSQDADALEQAIIEAIRGAQHAP